MVRGDIATETATGQQSHRFFSDPRWTPKDMKIQHPPAMHDILVFVYDSACVAILSHRWILRSRHRVYKGGNSRGRVEDRRRGFCTFSRVDRGSWEGSTPCTSQRVVRGSSEGCKRVPYTLQRVATWSLPSEEGVPRGCSEGSTGVTFGTPVYTSWYLVGASAGVTQEEGQQNLLLVFGSSTPPSFCRACPTVHRAKRGSTVVKSNYFVFSPRVRYPLLGKVRLRTIPNRVTARGIRTHTYRNDRTTDHLF